MTTVFGIAGFVLAIVLPVIYVRKERESRGGIISFGDAFKVAFIGLLIGGAIGIAFQIIYIQAIDPEYPERITAQSLEMSNSFMEGTVDDEMREQILRDAEADTLEKFSVTGMLLSFVYISIFYAVLSLIMAVVLKRNPDAAMGDTLDG
jgi:hypothetical protein